MMKDKRNKTLFSGSNAKGSKPSAILSLVNRLTAFIYSLFLYGTIGRRVARDSEKEGLLAFLDRKIGSVYKSKFPESPIKPLSLLLNNRATRSIGGIGHFFATLSLSAYGTFFVMLGIGSAVIYYLNLFLEWGRGFDEWRLISAMIIAVCATPFIFSGHTPLSMVRSGALARIIFIRYLAIPEERFEDEKKHRGGLFIGLAMLAGVIVGAATYFIHPLHIILALVIVIIVAIIMTNPESGLMITIPITPFLQYTQYSEQILLMLIVITAFSFILKCLKRQRHIKSTRAVFSVLLFCGILIFKSFFFGTDNLTDAMYAFVYIAGAYVLASNLIRTEKMADNAIKVLYASMAVICLIAIGETTIDTISRIMSYNISSTVGGELEHITISLADSAGIFGIFASMLLPVFFSRSLSHKGIVTTTLRIIAFSFLLVCTLVFGTFEAALCILLVMVLYIFIKSHKTVGMILAVSIPVAILVVIFPILRGYMGIDSPIVYIQNIFPQINASAPYAAETARGVWDMLAHDGNWFGIGIGKDAFTNAFAPYANAVTSNAQDASNLYLQIACWSGISGLLVFGWSILLHIKRGIGCMIRTTNYQLRDRIAGLMCSILSVLLLGNFSFIWQDARMLYMFWLVLGIFGFYIREGITQEHTEAGNTPSSETSIDVTAKI